MPEQKLPAIIADFNPPSRKRRGGPHLGAKNRVRIAELVRSYWARGLSPVPKQIGFDIDLDPSQVVRHLRALEEQGMVVRRRVPGPSGGMLLYVDQPG